MNRSRPETMLFDLDGTLFETETISVPAYHATFDHLRREGTYKGETPPVERFLGGLGLLLEQIWARVMPDAGTDVHRRADELMLHYQMEALKRGDGRLYPGVKETLQTLRARGIRLFVASNGLELYVKEVVRSAGIGHLFEGLYSAGEYQTRSKTDLVKLLLERHGVRSAWMVGDRSSDVEAGHGNGLPVVGCKYAQFGKPGELDKADMIITAFPQLLDLIDSGE